MRSLTYQILISSSYDELPKEAKYYVNRLATKASKNPFVSKILEGWNDIAIETDDIECLLSGAFIDSDTNRRAGCSWYLKTKIFLFVLSTLTGVTIPKLLKKNFCLLLQSLVIASYFAKEGYVHESLFNWDYEE